MNKRADWDFLKGTAYGDLDFLRDKEALATSYITQMLTRTQLIFEWGNLPESLDPTFLELGLQTKGLAVIAKNNEGELVYFRDGGLGGKPNGYYFPTQAIVANPGFNVSKTFDIDVDCVVIKNDVALMGLIAMFNRYAGLLAEADISLRMCLINARVPAFIYADNDNSKADAEQLLKDVEEGKKLGIIGGSSFFEGIKGINYANSSSQSLIQIMEIKQYLKSSWWQELGLNALYNMKRESINSSETSVDDDILNPLIDEMLKERKAGAERINKLFGTNITVELSSSWGRNALFDEATESKLEEEIENPGEGDETPKQEETPKEDNPNE